jgi:hypothetical protein
MARFANCLRIPVHAITESDVRSISSDVRERQRSIHRIGFAALENSVGSTGMHVDISQIGVISCFWLFGPSPLPLPAGAAGGALG